MKINSLIYKITNTVTNKIYIGQTSKTLEERWATHLIKHSNKKVNLLLYNSMRKHGVNNFKIELIEIVPTNNVCEREIYYIKLYNSFYIFGKGYNMTLGGENANTITNHPNKKDILKKMSVAKLGAKNKMFNKKHSKETKIKMKQNHANFKKENHPGAKSFKVISPKGIEHTVIGNFMEFCKTNNLSHHVLRNNVNKGVITNITHKRSLRHNGWEIKTM